MGFCDGRKTGRGNRVTKNERAYRAASFRYENMCPDYSDPVDDGDDTERAYCLICRCEMLTESGQVCGKCSERKSPPCGFASTVGSCVS